MKIIADVCLIPIGVGVSLSPYVQIAHDALKDADVSAQLHPYGTIVEGDYDKVMAAVKASMEAVHAAGCSRINVTMKFGSRTDKDQSAQDKVDKIRQ